MQELAIMPASSIVSAVLPLPPSVNKSYKIGRVPARTGTFHKGTRIYSSEPRMISRLVPTPELEQFKEQAAWALKNTKTTAIDWQIVEAIKASKQKVPLSITLKFFLPTLWKRDCDNNIKAVQDAVFSFLGLNDNLVVQIVAKKFADHEDPRVEVQLSCVVGR